MSQPIKEITINFPIFYEESSCMCTSIVQTGEYVPVTIYDGEIGLSIFEKIKGKVSNTKIKYIHPIFPETHVTTDGRFLYINSGGRGGFVRIRPFIVKK